MEVRDAVAKSSPCCKAFLTGGAGFIGSNLVDALLGFLGVQQVTIYDNFSTGYELNLAKALKDHRTKIVKADVLNLPDLIAASKGHDAFFHFQANADVRGGIHKTDIDLQQNTIGTWNALEAARINGIKTFVFASSATVYGEPKTFPTSECEPLIQTSLYGASKLAGEAMVQAYAGYFGMQVFIFRFVSWIGERYSHGVIYDFIRKLKQSPTSLEILGDGKQKKSYLHVEDGVSGILAALLKSKERINIFNLGHDRFLTVDDLTTIVIDELGLTDVRREYAGGERGWIGDSPLVHLDASRIGELGWSPKVSLENGIRRTTRFLMENEYVMSRL